jgi:hypothetical protein
VPCSVLGCVLRPAPLCVLRPAPRELRHDLHELRRLRLGEPPYRLDRLRVGPIPHVQQRDRGLLRLDLLGLERPVGSSSPSSGWMITRCWSGRCASARSTCPSRSMAPAAAACAAPQGGNVEVAAASSANTVRSIAQAASNLSPNRSWWAASMACLRSLIACSSSGCTVRPAAAFHASATPAWVGSAMAGPPRLAAIGSSRCAHPAANPTSCQRGRRGKAA